MALPIKDEQDRIQTALAALDLAARRIGNPVLVVALVNNSSDRSCARILEIAPRLGITLHLHQITLPLPLANAGNARRLAMEIAAGLVPDGVLMTTDADAVVSPDWLRAGLMSLAGADVVCGAIRPDGATAISAASRRVERIEAKYAAALHEVRFAVDQLCGRQRCRPHYMESGASLALHVRAYDAIGGLPAVACSEDRALVHSAESHGLRLRYCNRMSATVSTRLLGRAQGGMAECLRARRHAADPLADQAMLPPDHIVALWERAQSGQNVLWPDRSAATGRRLRISELEAALPELRYFVARTVRGDVLPGANDAR
ncbi:Glycosyl transferase family 2 [Paracoccus laeviglucosivorans]|uniref:Glycosyl transferase family 2 n=1 Tax=Paracoccus laeviglucosivorans TaxID=1197861 RepID=A0A521FQA4_9RHOB|nr:Glycosyl transferase family 2 [Paracoccus laeviglucosivorans]